jgi:hypothetical protein
MRSFDLKRSSKEEVKSYGIIENVTKEETRFFRKNLGIRKLNYLKELTQELFCR